MPLRLTVTLALLVAASAAKAELIERDWLAPGDGLLTYNPATGREWLDVTQTFLQPYGDTIDEAVTLAKLDLELGGRFEGFTLAGREEVIELVAASGFVNTFPENQSTADRLRVLLNLLDVRGEEILGEFGGPLLDAQAGGIYGVINEMVAVAAEGDTVNMTARLLVTAGSTFSPSGTGGLRFTNTTGEQRFPFQYYVHASSLMLYRTAVPEPTALAAMLVLLLTPYALLRSESRL